MYYKKLRPEHFQHLKFSTEIYTDELLSGMLQSIHYPADYDFDDNLDDEDNEFLNHHMEVSKCLVMVARCLPEKMKTFLVKRIKTGVLDLMASHHSNGGGVIAANSSAVPFSTIEAHLHMLYSFAEGMNNNKILRTPDLIQIISLIHTCGINLHNHPCVILKYFDISFRFAKPLLQNNVEILKSVLTTLLGTQGLRNPQSIVRTGLLLHETHIKILQKPVAKFFNEVCFNISNIKNSLSRREGCKRSGCSTLSKDNRYVLYDVCGMLMTPRTLQKPSSSQSYLWTIAPCNGSRPLRSCRRHAARRFAPAKRFRFSW